MSLDDSAWVNDRRVKQEMQYTITRNAFRAYHYPLRPRTSHLVYSDKTSACLPFLIFLMPFSLLLPRQPIEKRNLAAIRCSMTLRLKTRATMAAGGDETRKMMGDPYALGGFVPDRDRHGIKHLF